MAERDAEKDLALLEDLVRHGSLEMSSPVVADMAINIAPYWIKRAQELEQERDILKKALEIAAVFIDVKDQEKNEDVSIEERWKKWENLCLDVARDHFGLEESKETRGEETE